MRGSRCTRSRRRNSWGGWRTEVKSFPSETRKKMSEAAKRRCTPEWRKLKSAAYSTKLDVGQVRSMYETGHTQAEIAVYMGTTQKVIWRFMRNNGIKARKAAKRDQRGEKNSSWKGEKALYGSYHQRVKSNRGRASDYGCCVCGAKGQGRFFDWANLTGNYNDIMDYAPMCRPCHREYDKGGMRDAGTHTP